MGNSNSLKIQNRDQANGLSPKHTSHVFFFSKKVKHMNIAASCIFHGFTARERKLYVNLIIFSIIGVKIAENMNYLYKYYRLSNRLVGYWGGIVRYRSELKLSI